MEPKFFITVAALVLAMTAGIIGIYVEGRKARATRLPGPFLFNGYEELPLSVYLRILDYATTLEPEDGMPKILAELTGRSEESILNLTIPEYTALVAASEWLQKDPPVVTARRRYRAGAFELTVLKDFTGMTASQFIDAQTLVAEPEGRMLDLLAVCLVPVGHAYADGYELDEVKAAIADHITAPDAAAIRDFFLKRSERLMRRFLTSSAGMATMKLMQAKTPAEKAAWEKTLQTIMTAEQNFRKSGGGSRPLTMSLTLPVAVGRMLLKSL